MVSVDDITIAKTWFMIAVVASMLWKRITRSERQLTNDDDDIKS